jgi:hypothetical protein
LTRTQCQNSPCPPVDPTDKASTEGRHPERRRRSARAWLAALPILAGCDALLDVDYPHEITGDDLTDAITADLQVHSAIALFECGYTAFGLFALGHEGTMSSTAGVGSTNHVFAPSASAGACDSSDTSIAWFDQIMGTRAMLTNPEGTGAYDRLQREWALGDRGERLSAMSAMYVAMSLAHLGEFMCDITLDGSDLIPHDEVLAMAEEWVTERALVHLANAGDFAMPNGIASSTEAMAYSLRARIRWARGDLAGADADAATAPQRFTTWITREAGRERRNKIWFNGTFGAYSILMPLHRSWNGPNRQPNPATGQLWPSILPFTGYLHLGVTPDGRMLEPGDIPVRWANESFGGSIPATACNASSPQPGCVTGALADGRVTYGSKSIGIATASPFRYGTFAAGSDDADIPYMTWEELTLIRAEHANDQGGQSSAIAFINAIRAAPTPLPTNPTMGPLPAISGAYLAALTNGAVDEGQTDQEAVRAAILEERRREFYSEAGRFWSTKLKNLDMLWFPRLQGTGWTYAYQGGVRLAMPDREYERNPYLLARGGLAARGTGCAPAEAPVFP